MEQNGKGQNGIFYIKFLKISEKIGIYFSDYVISDNGYKQRNQ